MLTSEHKSLINEALVLIALDRAQDFKVRQEHNKSTDELKVIVEFY